MHSLVATRGLAPQQQVLQSCFVAALSLTRPLDFSKNAADDGGTTVRYSHLHGEGQKYSKWNTSETQKRLMRMLRATFAGRPNEYGPWQCGTRDSTQC